MPRTTFPPTPEASTEIFGKDGEVLISDDTHFSLPPSAIGGRDSSSSSSISDKASDSSYVPTSPPAFKQAKDGASSRRRSGPNAKDDFALPPPPTRKRKIIQMNPSEQPQSPSQRAQAPVTSPSKPETPTTGTKRKQSSGTSAGRKVARKTAHSLIERRRRSKMNEEFSVLKNMIPACAGQEMHKLAILQASTEYLRYLEQCVTDLKAAAHSNHATGTSTNRSSPLSTASTPAPTNSARLSTTNDHRMADYSSNEEDEDEDEGDADMADEGFDPQPSTTHHAAPPPTHQTHNRSHSLNYTRPHSSSSTHLPFPINTTTTTSAPHTSPAALFPATPPASGQLGSAGHKPDFRLPGSSLPSPAHEEEATAALLMLNALDRRSSVSSAAAGSLAAGAASPHLGGRRGMSVRDLLSN